MAFQFTWPSELNRLQSKMDQLFGRGNGSLARPKAYPAINVLEDDENLYVESEIPGLELEQLELFVNDENQLNITGRVAARNEGLQVLRQEYGIGDFQRTFTVGESIQADTINAEVHNGVLVVHLPKAESAKPRRIAVKAV